MGLKYPVHLTEAQRRKIKEWLSSKQLNRREVIRAKVLLRSDRSGGRRVKERAEIGQSLGICAQTVSEIRQRFYDLGLRKSIVLPASKRPRRAPAPAPRVMTEEVVAALERLLLQSPPSNKARWSTRALAAELKALGYSVSRMAICRAVGKERLMRTDRLDTQSFRLAVKRVLASPCHNGRKWTVASLRRRLVSTGEAPVLSYSHFFTVVRRMGLDPANLEKSAKQL